jgi:Spy/CpxP family protein refolding chaperone
MKTYFSCLVAVLVAAALGGVSVYGGAAPESEGPEKIEETKPETMPPFLRGVTLTEEQKTKVHEILQSQRPAAQDTMKRILAIRNELGNRILYPGKLDEDQLAPLLEQLLFLQNQIQRQNFRTMLEIRNLLTAEQMAQGVEYRERMKAQQSQSKPGAEKKN